MSTKPQDPNFESRVRNNFGEQTVMHTIGARLTHLEAGKAEIEMPTRDDLAQQNGYVHAGIVTTILDSGCGYAALSMWPAGSGVLSVEFKVNLLAPAKGEMIRVRAEVKRAGRRLTVCTADAFAVDGERETICATMLATMICIEPKRS